MKKLVKTKMNASKQLEDAETRLGICLETHLSEESSQKSVSESGSSTEENSYFE